MFDTIAAIASGNINQAISIIRMSGPDAFKIIAKIFSGKIKNDKQISYGYIFDENKNCVDEVLVCFFKGENNFVGEDTIEINCHGGILVTNRVLELLLVNGARMAERGEFSRRSFLNGKMDLIKAEAINDLIHAKTIMQTKIAIQKFNNNSSNLINKLIDEVEYLIGICEVNIDYPEYDDIEKMDSKKLYQKTENLIAKISEIINISENNQIYSNPVRVVIVGKPNSGKSALLNVILNEDKSIVTEIQGTTRDVVEGEIVFNGILLKFSDTAGIRNSKDKIEKIGIEKSFQEIKKAALVIHLLDIRSDFSEMDLKIKDKAKDKIYLQVYNKKDLITNLSQYRNKILISAKNKDIVALEHKLKQIFEKNINQDIDLFFNQREIVLLKNANLCFKNVLSSIKEGFGYEVTILDIHEGWTSLKSIIGDANKEELLDSIFKNFCLGK